MPQVTVLMCAYNAAAFVQKAIESVLAQSYTNFEFLIIDDGSTDDTAAVISSVIDKRIRFLRREHDYIASLNVGLELSRGKYIARMDADDVMHPDRLRIQHAILEEEASVDVCGSRAQLFGDGCHEGRCPHSTAGLIENAAQRLLRGNFLCHPTVMLRKSTLDRFGLRYLNYPCAEDYKLWTDLALNGAGFYIVPQPLLYYRMSEQQLTRTRLSDMQQSAGQIQDELINRLIERSALPHSLLRDLYASLMQLRQLKRLSQQDVTQIFYQVLMDA